jgi:chemotaxis response regulator CheB
MRIAIVNDMRLAVEALRRAVMSAPEHEIAWVAFDGAEAVRRCKEDQPDLVLMDLMMPVMDGATATREIMRQTPVPILVVTVSVTEHAKSVFEAMGAGALDAVNTPVLGPDGDTRGARELVGKIAMIAKLLGHTQGAVAAAAVGPSRDFTDRGVPLLAIGSSTGGPHALATVLAGLPRDFPAAVVIVQHIDADFAGGLAAWLDDQSALPVAAARAGDAIVAGRVLIAATDDHLIVQPNGTVAHTPDPIEYPHRPSVDVFFTSAAASWRGRGVGVLLTGMGRDGAEGLLALRGAGWHTIAQDKETSVVYGMPAAAHAIGAAVEILPIQRIATAVAACCARGVAP